MTTENRSKVLGLIKRYCIPSKHYYRWSSYALKGVFEKLAGCYISNEDFKSLMLEAGFMPTKKSVKDGNHRYKLDILQCPEINIYYWGRGSEAYKYG